MVSSEDPTEYAWDAEHNGNAVFGRWFRLMDDFDT